MAGISLEIRRKCKICGKVFLIKNWIHSTALASAVK